MQLLLQSQMCLQMCQHQSHAPEGQELAGQRHEMLLMAGAAVSVGPEALIVGSVPKGSEQSVAAA